MTAEPGAIELRGHLELDEKKLRPDVPADQAIDASLAIMHRRIDVYQPWIGKRVPGDPDLAPDICYQLMRSVPSCRLINSMPSSSCGLMVPGELLDGC